MEARNPIEGVRLRGAVASLRSSRDGSLGTCRSRASVYLAGKKERIDGTD